ncbi:hypothetical protein LWI28_028796 [Acer negundo]|uniref:Ubiquitin-like domain-containing protein n=1 Tax=Acer negundo TaxID=4023 RepID=A0AAD5P3I9_ACENE|nr:hypothetical protein LWI28_028796 [Acer negundo]
MGGYDSGSASKDDRDEDDEEEYDEESGGNRLLGFMFGMLTMLTAMALLMTQPHPATFIWKAEAPRCKEHLAALADKLGSSLTDIDLSVKSLQTPADAAEQDYDEKAEDAVDYEDIEEQYEGPEIQAASEEDYLNEYEKEQEVVHKENELSTVSLSGEQGECGPAVLEGVKSIEDEQQVGSLGTEEDMEVEGDDINEEVADIVEEPLDDQVSTPLPVLFVEDGSVILRFSEIFGIREPLKKRGKGDQIYYAHRDKYNNMDFSNLVEEDEEAYLKGSCFSFIQEHEVQHDISFLSDDSSEFAKFGDVEDAHPISNVQRKDSCLSSEPMKEDLTVNLSVGWQSMLSPKFFPLDQNDWEEKILWDNSPAVSDNSMESCEIAEPETKATLIRETENESGQHNVLSMWSMNPDEKNRNIGMQNTLVLLDPFGSRNSSEHTDHATTESRCHPQLLRLQSRLDMDSLKNEDVRSDNLAGELCQSDAVKQFSKLKLQNRDMMEGSWLDNIIWEPQEAVGKPKLILDLQDEQMLFEILDNKDSKHLQLHAGAMIVTRSVKPSGADSFELSGRKYQSDWQFNIANDKFYMNGKISQQLQSNSNKRTAHGIRVHHSAPALKLQTMKLKLSNKDIANFHRPKALWYPHDNEVAVKEQGKLPTQGPMKIIVKSLGGKGSKLHVDAEETVSSIKTKASKKLDFKPVETVKLYYLGKELEDHKSLAEQNVQPNSLLHLVRTKIHLLPRAQKLPGENKSLRPPGAFKKKSDLSVKDGHVILMEYCEERPLLLSNAGMGSNLCTYYQNHPQVIKPAPCCAMETTAWGIF